MWSDRYTLPLFAKISKNGSIVLLL
jgi:hypothetical protein